jgi:UDP-N-acetylmuramate dehydrogenase
MLIEERVPFATNSTFKVGGVAQYRVTLESSEDIPDAIEFVDTTKLPHIVLGGGSNILARDLHHSVVVMRVGMNTIRQSDDSIISADAGALWDDVVKFAVERNLWGIENLSAIPGTVGGAVVQNIGAYGAALSQVVVRVCAFDTYTKKKVEFENFACNFGYRSSIFKSLLDRYIVLTVDLRVTRDTALQISYKDLALYFQDHQSPNLSEVRTAVQKIRSRKFPPLDEYGTAGSFFLNIVVNEETAERLRNKYPAMPLFVLPEGGIKVPVGWFFEHVLNLKGYQEGLVEAWREQALVIVAHRGATANDVLDFVNKILDRAQNEIGITLVPEVRVL